MRFMLLLGVDEAGKGPVLGSMFIAGVVMDEEQLFDLAGIGVKDSKQLTPARRELLSKKITAAAKGIYILEVTANMIDELRGVMTMNEIMVRSHAQVLTQLHADKAILDAADVNEQRFAKRVKDMSRCTMEVLAEHKADSKHLVVAAASIVAKVSRDSSMRELEQRIGAVLGSGYPSDPDTKRYLKSYAAEHGCPPPCARKSWKTAQRLKSSSE
jgi:ribonuclease HII